MKTIILLTVSAALAIVIIVMINIIFYPVTSLFSFIMIALFATVIPLALMERRQGYSSRRRTTRR